MRLLPLLLLLIHVNCFAQSYDSTVYHTKDVLVRFNPEVKRYKIITNKIYSDLKFVKKIVNYFQVLDAYDRIFYIGPHGEFSKNVSDYQMVCGTVMQIELSTKHIDSTIQVIERKGIRFISPDSKQKIKQEISTQQADSVLFINGKTKFEYSENFGLGIGDLDPNKLILVKNGRYFLMDNPDVMFDSIRFRNNNSPIVTMRNHLYGVLDVFPPTYKKIGDFTYYLARAQTEDGSDIVIDIEGNEY